MKIDFGDFGLPDLTVIKKVVDPQNECKFFHAFERRQRFMAMLVEIDQWHHFVESDGTIGEDYSSADQRKQWM